MNLSKEQIDAMANLIARRLFTNGEGQRAYRLVLISSEGRDLGGWGELPAVDQVRRAIIQAMANRDKT